MSLFKKTAFGLDISDFSIEALKLDSRKRVKAFGRVVLGEGVVNDGFIIDKEKLVGKIQEVLNQAGIRTKEAILSVPESKVFVHIFQMPDNLKKERLKNAIRNEIEKTLPLEPSKICWDYQIISRDLENNQQLILFVGTLKEIVSDYTEVLSKAGVKIIALEIESLALGRSLLKEFKPKKGIVIVDIGARITNISIFDKYVILKESAIVSVAGSRFTRAIADKLGVSSEKAEKFKRNYGLFSNMYWRKKLRF